MGTCLPDRHLQIMPHASEPQCRQTCDYFGLCGGGAGSNQYWENGSFNSTETLACRYRIQEIAEVVIGALEESLGIT